jgi:hypothetical protein
MKYMMFVCTDSQPDLDGTDEPDIEVWVADNDARGRRLDGHELAPPTAATTVRVRGGELLITDGPFAETKEVIVGYDLLECADLDEAIELRASTRWAGTGGSNSARSPTSPMSRVPEPPAAAAVAEAAAAPVADAVAAASAESFARIVAGLIRVTGDWTLAEDCAQEARPRPGTVARFRDPGQPGRVAHDGRPQSRDRRRAAGVRRGAQAA